MKRKVGTVYLVGAGPGDPGLLTLRGAELLRQAEVVVCDALANPELLQWVPSGAEVIRRGPDRRLSPEEIVELMIRRAREGKQVVRLKGGDAYVFGRGGEEAAALRRAGIPFEVVPGVSSAIAVPAAAGIPLTRRGVSSSFTVVTGHEDPAKPVEAVDLRELAQGSGTRVILMGAARIRPLAQQLMAHGLDPATPVAMVREGTTPRQQTIVGRLDQIADLAEAADLKPPVVTVIGQVVSLREELNWFEQLPLFGRRIVVTRAKAQAGELIEAFRRLGAEVLAAPAIRIAPPENPALLAEALADLNAYDWLVFTSVNGVESFMEHFFRHYEDMRHLGGVRVAAVGPATAARLRAFHVGVDAMPAKFEGKAVVEAIQEHQSLENLRLLLLRAEVATPELPRILEDKGAIVDDIPCYRTVAETELDPTVETRLREQGADWVTFASGSSVLHFHERFDLPGLRRRFPGLRCASIGPQTSAALRELGIQPDAEAHRHTTDGLVEAVLRAEQPPGGRGGVGRRKK